MPQEVLHAAAVSLFQYNTSKQSYDGRGQVGAAITGDSSGVYKLVCYENQQSYLCTATITSSNEASLKFQLKQNETYAGFRDDNGQQWSLFFTEESSALMFSMYVGLAIYGASGTQTHSICSVELTEHPGQTVDVNDSVGVKFNGYYVGSENGMLTLSYQYDSNMQSKHTYRFQIPQSNTLLQSDMKGFEGAICGMGQGSRRCLVIPAACRGGTSAGGQATLIVLVDVKKIKKEEKPQQPQQQQQVQNVGFQDWQKQQQPQNAGMLTMAGQQSHIPVAQPLSVSPMQPQVAPMMPATLPTTVAPAVAAAPAASSPAGLTIEQLKTVNETSSSVVTLLTHVNELNQKLDMLSADFKIAQKKEKPTTLTAAQLQHSVTAMLDENKQCKDEIRAKDDMIKTLENRNLDLEKKVDKFAQSAHQLMEEKKSAASGMSDTRLEMDRRVLKLQEDLQRANSERDDSQRHLATVKKLLDLSEDEIRKLKGETEITKVQSENNKMKISHVEDALRTEKEARKLSDDKVLSLSAEVQELRDTLKRKETALQEKTRKLEADRQHFNNLMEEERDHAEREMKSLRDEMLVDLQSREKRFATEKERISNDSYSRGTDQGKEDGLAEARIRYEEEMSKIRAEAMKVESDLKEANQQLTVEKENLSIEFEGCLNKIQNLCSESIEKDDKMTVLQAELQLEKEKNDRDGIEYESEKQALKEKLSDLTARLETELEAAEAAAEKLSELESRHETARSRFGSVLESLARDVVPVVALQTVVAAIFSGEAPDLSFEEDESLYPAGAPAGDAKPRAASVFAESAAPHTDTAASPADASGDAQPKDADAEDAEKTDAVHPAAKEEKEEDDDDWSEVASKEHNKPNKDSEASDDMVKVEHPKHEEKNEPARDGDKPEEDNAADKPAAEKAGGDDENDDEDDKAAEQPKAAKQDDDAAEKEEGEAGEDRDDDDDAAAAAAKEKEDAADEQSPEGADDNKDTSAPAAADDESDEDAEHRRPEEAAEADKDADSQKDGSTAEQKEGDDKAEGEGAEEKEEQPPAEDPKPAAAADSDDDDNDNDNDGVKAEDPSVDPEKEGSDEASDKQPAEKDGGSDDESEGAAAGAAPAGEEEGGPKKTQGFFDEETDEEGEQQPKQQQQEEEPAEDEELPGADGGAAAGEDEEGGEKPKKKGLLDDSDDDDAQPPQSTEDKDDDLPKPTESLPMPHKEADETLPAVPPPTTSQQPPPKSSFFESESDSEEAVPPPRKPAPKRSLFEDSETESD